MPAPAILTHTLDAWLIVQLRSVSPVQVARINRRVALELRRRQSQRIAAQQNPDGTPYAPRKPQPLRRKNLRGKKGKIKPKTMFRHLRTARFMKVQASPAQLTVGYRGRTGEIALAHQTGARDLPQRILLGLSHADIVYLTDAYLRHLAETMQAG